MARDFDGTNDNISFGSNASIDNFATRTYAFWLVWDATGVGDAILNKGSGTTSIFGSGTNASDVIDFAYPWATTQGVWTSTATISGTVPIHIVISYDNGSILNDPVMWINNVSDTVVETTTPVGATPNSDAANNLVLGELGGARDFDGRIQNLCYDSTIWTAEQVNRHFWHGRAGGAVVVMHPFYTTKLANEGTGTADGTVAGTTVVSIPRGSRPGCGVF